MANSAGILGLGPINLNYPETSFFPQMTKYYSASPTISWNLCPTHKIYSVCFGVPQNDISSMPGVKTIESTKNLPNLWSFTLNSVVYGDEDQGTVLDDNCLYGFLNT